MATNSSVVYPVANTMGKAVPQELLSGYKGTMVHDDWKPYNAITTAKHQLDLLHVNRWIERAEVRHGIEPRTLLGDLPAVLTRRGRPPDEFISFADGIRRILSSAVHAADKSNRARKRTFTIAGRELSALLDRTWRDEEDVRHALHIPKAQRRSMAQQPCRECNQAGCPPPQDKRLKADMDRGTCARMHNVRVPHMQEEETGFHIHRPVIAR